MNQQYDFLNKENFTKEDVVEILKVLRSENGCPWDRAQTHETLRETAIEEAYELSDAIAKEDWAHVQEELGDVLMQVYHHVGIAQDNGEFSETDVYNRLCRKLISRHTHVFGDVKVQNEQQALAVWNANKQKEHNIKTLAQNLDDVPTSMTPLLRAQKVQNRANKGGVEVYKDANEKIQQALTNFLKEVDVDKDGGDLLFWVLALLKSKHVNADVALSDAIARFIEKVKQS
ncbi:MAG: MazG family protein [Clostridia bacterium]|nr:MazG family protein [Clostridia bacterium]